MKGRKIVSKIIPVIGLQWGDEGKGKGVARIASGLSKRDLIVRFQGGNNAGHTIWHMGKCYVSSLLPSGLFALPQMHLGAGMVINPIALRSEILAVPKNISFLPRLTVSPHATLILPTHLLLDSVSEKSKGEKKIGSTGRGIAPAYSELVARSALRVGDIFYKDFKKRYLALSDEHINILSARYGYKTNPKEFKTLQNQFFEGIKFLSKLSIVSSSAIIDRTLGGGDKVVAEGAQGSLHDIRFGTYPYVTSSHTIASGVGTGLGLPPSYIGSTIGIFKAYVTRVGEGPFPTELGGGSRSATTFHGRRSTS